MMAGHHAPPRGSPSGIAHYAWQLAGEMERQGLGAPRVPLYHLGNNQLHWAIYRQALAEPGVVLLHDANLHHMHLGALNEDAYVAEFVYQYGAWHEGLARRLWQGRARAAVDPAFFQYTLLKRAAASARAVIVHNQGAAERVRSAAPDVPVEIIPHFTTPVKAQPQISRISSRLGLGAGDFVFGIFGHLRESKRVGPALRAFARARRLVPSLRLLVAGSFASTAYERALAPLLSHPGVVRAPYLDNEEEFEELLACADAAINLRYPSCGESSGIAARMMAAGKPVLLTSGLEWSAVPAAAYIGIDCGPAEEEMLVRAMVWLASDRSGAEKMGRTAAIYARENDLATIARRVASVLKKY